MKEQTRIGFALVLMTILTIAILILITQVIPPVRVLPEENEKDIPELLGPRFGTYEVPYLFKKVDGPYTDRIEKKLEAKQYDASGNRMYTHLN